jgi:hypothetical protein
MIDNNPFSPWNNPMTANDPFAPHNDPMKRNDPFQPWNRPFGNCRDLKSEDKKYYEDKAHKKCDDWRL